MEIKKGPGEVAFDSVNIFILILLSTVTLYPFLHVFFASLSDPVLFAEHTGFLYKPIGFSTAAYMAVFKRQQIWQGYMNTVIYVVLGTTINITLTSLAAYGLSRKNVFFAKPIMLMIVFTMFFSGGMIPNYLLITNLKLRDTVWAIVLPSAISAWNFIIMRTSFQAIPDSMEESARLDGANDFVILWKIILPLSSAIISVMVMFYGVSNYNRWFEAFLYLRDRTMHPLQLILREILVENTQEEMMTGTVNNREKIGLTIQYATIMVATIPIICIYPFLQKYFVKGVMVGAIKG